MENTQEFEEMARNLTAKEALCMWLYAEGLKEAEKHPKGKAAAIVSEIQKIIDNPGPGAKRQVMDLTMQLDAVL